MDGSDVVGGSPARCGTGAGGAGTGGATGRGAGRGAGGAGGCRGASACLGGGAGAPASAGGGSITSKTSLVGGSPSASIRHIWAPAKLASARPCRATEQVRSQARLRLRRSFRAIVEGSRTMVVSLAAGAAADRGQQRSQCAAPVCLVGTPAARLPARVHPPRA